MAGNREVFQQHMDTGYNAAWDQNWDAATRAFSQAVQEFPEDAEAHIQLGLSLLKAERLDDALKVYTKSHQLAPDDPTPVEKSAEVLERMGKLKEAAQQYVTVAEIYLGMRDLDKAISNWERATRLTPGLLPIHVKLARAYERVGDKKGAIREYLTLAFNFQHQNEAEKATKAVERALRLDKRNKHALNILRAIRSGAEVTLPDWNDAEENKPEPPKFINIEEAESDSDDPDPLGPMGEAMNNALGALAAHVMESGRLDAASGDALQALELQRQDQPAKAIEAYKRAAPRIDHPSLMLNLGALLLLNDDPKGALKYFNNASSDPVFSSGALHGMGSAYYKLGDHQKAIKYLIQCLQAVEIALAMDSQEKQELTESYSQLLNELGGATTRLSDINKTCIELLTGTDWKQRVADTRRHSEELMRTDPKALIDFWSQSDSKKIVAVLSQIDSYIRQGVLVLAMDLAHDAMMTAPFYLPLHVRMAEIMMREGRLRHAIEKYNAVARAYMAREENDQAASILVEVLEMAPLDVSVRKSLISLLESEDRIDEVLDQYIELAKTYNQLGNFDLAREMYKGSEELAEEIDASFEKKVLIKHNLADMDQMRLDTRNAIKTYEEIIILSPDDERAYRMLVDLNYSLGNQVHAIKYLDHLLGVYAKRKQTNKITKILEDLVKVYTTDTGLRSRLAGIYRQLKLKEKAIEQLDALGELQLEANMHDDARNTIRQIIALKPDNIEDYKRLLSKMK